MFEHLSVTASQKDKWINQISKCKKQIKVACFDDGGITDSARYYAPNDNEVAIYVRFDRFRLVEKNEFEQTLTAHVKMHMYWYDSRIKANFSHEKEVDSDYGKIKFWMSRILVEGKDIRNLVRIWLPDYDFDNQLKVQPVTESFILTSLNIVKKYGKNSTNIEMGLDMKVTVLCDFKFLDYPMDSQVCNLTFRNQRFPNNKFLLNVDHQDLSLREPFPALRSYITINFMAGNGKAKEKTGFKIHMKRVLTPFLLQCYAPAIAIVLISSIGFLVPLSAIPGRITLGVTLFLTLANIFYDNRVILKYFVLMILFILDKNIK